MSIFIHGIINDWWERLHVKRPIVSRLSIHRHARRRPCSVDVKLAPPQIHPESHPDRLHVRLFQAPVLPKQLLSRAFSVPRRRTRDRRPLAIRQDRRKRLQQLSHVSLRAPPSRHSSHLSRRRHVHSHHRVRFTRQHDVITLVRDVIIKIRRPRDARARPVKRLRPFGSPHVQRLHARVSPPRVLRARARAFNRRALHQSRQQRALTVFKAMKAHHFFAFVRREDRQDEGELVVAGAPRRGVDDPAQAQVIGGVEHGARRRGKRDGARCAARARRCRVRAFSGGYTSVDEATRRTRRRGTNTYEYIARDALNRVGFTNRISPYQISPFRMPSRTRRILSPM